MSEFYFHGSRIDPEHRHPLLHHPPRSGRLDPEQLARAWNGPSWACAIYFFGPLSLPAHFWVTRRTLLGSRAGHRVDHRDLRIRVSPLSRSGKRVRRVVTYLGLGATKT